MIDNFVLVLTHGLLLLAAWRILCRPDLDDDAAADPPSAPPATNWTAGGERA